MIKGKLTPTEEKNITEFFQMLGDTLHFLRLERGLSIRQLAGANRISRQVISRLEKGIHWKVRTETISKLCKYYDLTFREFFSFTNVSRKHSPRRRS